MDLNDVIKLSQKTGRRFFVGVDLGQVHDPTAIAVIEKISEWREPGVAIEAQNIVHRYELRHLERLPLGTSYPLQVAFVQGLLDREPLTLHKTDLAIDQTGVGRAVLDLFKVTEPRPAGITITGGRESSRSGSGEHVSKLQLVSTLQAKLHSVELKIASGLQDAKALVQELQEFRASYTTAGNAVFAAREGRHDDLVLAVAIALWRATTTDRRTISTERLRW